MLPALPQPFGLRVAPPVSRGKMRGMTAPNAARPSDPPLRTLPMASGPACYTDEGEGPALIAIHGLPASARDFRWLAPRVSEHLRFIRLELPGFGGTPSSTHPDPSPKGRARFILEFVEELGLTGVERRPVLLGHSMGGVAACAAVDLAPDAFSGLALIASPGLRPHRQLARFPAGPLYSALRRPWVASALAPVVRRGFERVGFKGYPDTEIHRSVACVAHTSIARHARNIRALSLPTLTAHCEDDPLIEADILDTLSHAVPPGPRLRWAKGGHNPQKTHAEELGRALVEWTMQLAARDQPRDAPAA